MVRLQRGEKQDVCRACGTHTWLVGPQGPCCEQCARLDGSFLHHAQMTCAKCLVGFPCGSHAGLR